MYIKKNENIQKLNIEFTNFINSYSIEKKNQLNYDDNYISFLLLKKLMTIIFALTLPYFYIEYITKKKNENNDDNIKYDIIIPVNINDVNKLIKQTDYLKKCLNFDRMVIIAPNTSNFLTQNITSIIIDEDYLVPKENLIKLFNIRRINKTDRIGWYEQQFLKMSYSRICKNDYYLLWDADTIPIKKVNMFINGYPIFDIKSEHHQPYFNTIKLLLPNLRFSKFSYISEHMIIKTEFMKNLLEQIEKNTIIKGTNFWDKILMSIDKKDIIQSGFSEFETYGSFVDTYYPNYYKHREWSSKREMVKFFGKIDNLCQNDFDWLSKDFNSISFEKWDRFENNYLNYVKSPRIQKLCRPKRFFKYYKRIIKKYKYIIKS